MTADIRNLEELLPLISQWGTAIEQGQDAQQLFDTLCRVRVQNPDLMREAVELAFAHQDMMIGRAVSDLSETDPSHPVQRRARVDDLHEALAL